LIHQTNSHKKIFQAKKPLQIGKYLQHTQHKVDPRYLPELPYSAMLAAAGFDVHGREEIYIPKILPPKTFRVDRKDFSLDWKFKLTCKQY
jgi:hypothetical protein